MDPPSRGVAVLVAWYSSASMSELWGPRQPRPVAEAPLAELAECAEDLAKHWLLALVAAAPLDAASALPVAELVREAPELCAAVARALGSDRDLERLRPGGDLSRLAAGAGRIAGARDPAAAVAAIEALRRVVWAMLLDLLERPGSEEVAALAERLGQVCAVLAQGVLIELAHGSGSEPSTTRPGPPSPRAVAGPAEGETPPDPFVEPSLEGPLALHDVRPRGTGPLRTDAGQSWIAAFERRIERQVRDGAPFAGLLVEADGVERLLVAETGREVAIAIEAVERAISDELRPADKLVREALGRYWLIAPDTSGAGANTLADRVADAVGRRASHRSVPMSVSIGVVICPEDGSDAAGLAALAEERMFAARAGGRHRVGPPVE